MQLFDIVKDKDAYIDGMIIHKEGNMINVLWSNGVIGPAKDDLSQLAFLGHRDVRRFLVTDILHTGHHGPEGMSKEGAKYDGRKDKVLLLEMDLINRGRGIILHLYDKSFFQILDRGIEPDERQAMDIYTTNFEKMYEENGKLMLRTLNSIYVLEGF